MTKTSIREFVNGNIGYPQPLTDLADPPDQLYWKGSAWNDFGDYVKLGIVGSRKCSSYGRSVIETLVSGLYNYKVVIVSGLALGADSIAHRAALQAGLPTIAVLPTSIDKIYPATHRGLADEIVAKGGALASEYSGYTPSLKHHFIARNRIIAALSEAVLIPEAALGSGSLHTANFALDCGRAVCAVPGNITNPLSEGTNNLIKQGASPITHLEDLLEALGIQKEVHTTEHLIADSQEELVILAELQRGPCNGATLYEASNLPLRLYQQTLTLLEIKGRIQALGADIWSIK